jgi:hypothetical protein
MGECTLGSATSERRPCNGACLRGCVAANVVHFLRTGVHLESIDADCGRISSPRRDLYCSALQSRRYGSGMFIASPDYHPLREGRRIERICRARSVNFWFMPERETGFVAATARCPRPSWRPRVPHRIDQDLSAKVTARPIAVHYD